MIALDRAYRKLRRERKGRLDRDSLLEGSESLIGSWFPEAWDDPERRGYGVAFETAEERIAFRPEQRMRRASLGPLTPPELEPADQHWATYDPVELPDPNAALELLREPARRCDIGSANGRFTALRAGGLPGQTFEIEVVADVTPRSPIFTRGYVTCTEFHTSADDVGSAVAALDERYRAGAGDDAREMLPADAEPLALVVLTTHEGHFLGSALSHLLVWRGSAGSWIRDVGAWDPLPAHLSAAYKMAGREAQRAFWGPEPEERSMLAQLAKQTGP